MTQWRRGVLAMAVGALAFVGAIDLAAPSPARAQAYATGDMALGPADAPITVIEYASMTCPHCATFHNEAFPELKARYIDTGKVRFIYREFPLDAVALRAAMLTRCAGPKRFFGFVEVLFRRQEHWARAKDPMAALARLGQVGGIGRKQFESCMNDRELVDSIIERRLEGSNEFEVRSTPTFIINGEKHPGQLNVQQFDRVLEPLLPKD